MASLSDLAVRMRKLAKRYDSIGSEIAVKTALAIIDDVIDHTPVDKGDTVSSWSVGYGSPPEASRTAFAPGRKGSTAEANREAAKIAAHAILAAPKRPGVPIFISNASDAIVFLDGGSSSQEPAGFVARSILIGRQFVAGFRSEKA